jgi:hypothetical protein
MPSAVTDRAITEVGAQEMPAFPKIIRTDGLARLLLLVFGPALAGLAVLAAISVGSGITISTFVREYKSSAEYPFVGLLSDVGILLWTATASISLFSSMVLRKWKSKKPAADFFLYSALLTALLTIDDFFLIHESVSVRDRYIFLGYLVGMLFILIKSREYIADSPYELLFLTLFFFGMSLFVDLFQHRIEGVIGDWRIFFEDGFKFLGIVGWFAYFASCCFETLSVRSPEQP